jgi:hypothetical protein
VLGLLCVDVGCDGTAERRKPLPVVMTGRGFADGEEEGDPSRATRRDRD